MVKNEDEMMVGTTSGPDQQAPVEQLQARLSDWRSRIDTLLVQLDLASMELRQAFQSELARMENARLALRSGLGNAREGLAAMLPTDRAAVGEALREIERAFQAARASLTR